jgi:hypothetical protein
VPRRLQCSWANSIKSAPGGMQSRDERGTIDSEGRIQLP